MFSIPAEDDIHVSSNAKNEGHQIDRSGNLTAFQHALNVAKPAVLEISTERASAQNLLGTTRGRTQYMGEVKDALNIAQPTLSTCQTGAANHATPGARHDRKP